MTEKQEIEDLDLSDSELIRILKNHGMDRRSVMKVIGAGTGVVALGGTATGTSGQDGKIDEVFGASFAEGVHTVPSGLVDQGVELHIHEDGHHDGFPQLEGGPEGNGPEENGAGGDAVEDDPEGDSAEEGPPPEAFFDPVGLHVEPGDVVSFTTHGVGLHTVTSIHPKYSEPPFLVFPERVPTDHGFTSPPIATDDTWLYRFSAKGVYDLVCLPHAPLGMVMRVVVFEEGDCIEASTFAEPEPDSDAPLPPNAAAVLDADELDPSNIVSEGRVAWEDLTL